jgi:hypothetical protein
MPDPPLRPVYPLGKHLLQPLHNFRQFHPVRRLDKKPQPIILKPQSADRETKPEPRLTKHPGKDIQGRIAAEKGFPIVDPGTDIVPYVLSQHT